MLLHIINPLTTNTVVEFDSRCNSAAESNCYDDNGLTEDRERATHSKGYP